MYVHMYTAPNDTRPLTNWLHRQAKRDNAKLSEDEWRRIREEVVGWPHDDTLATLQGNRSWSHWAIDVRPRPPIPTIIIKHDQKPVSLVPTSKVRAR